jgi:hypothetical protein
MAFTAPICTYLTTAQPHYVEIWCKEFLTKSVEKYEMLRVDIYLRRYFKYGCISEIFKETHAFWISLFLDGNSIPH